MTITGNMSDLSSPNLPAICNICDYIAKEFSKNYPQLKVSSDFKTNVNCEIDGADINIWNDLFKRSFLMRIRDDENSLWVWLRIRDDWSRFEPGFGFGERFIKITDVELCDPNSFDKIYGEIIKFVEISIAGVGGENVNEIL